MSSANSAETARLRSLRSRIGAHALHAQYDSRELTANARKAFLDSFECQVDPEGLLPPEERAKRADHARKAHFTRLALKSAQARQSQAAQKQRRRS